MAAPEARNRFTGTHRNEKSIAMSAEQSLREGRLLDALAELQAQVRKEPANAKHRIFLFQLLAALGQWERALNQLNVVGEMDALALPMVQTYREALRCEIFRAEVFTGRRSPLILATPRRGWRCCWKPCA